MLEKQSKLAKYFLYAALTLIVITFLLIITACAKECEKCQDRVVISTDVVEKNIPVGCQFPDVDCDFYAEGFGVTENMLKCIKLQKELINNCKSDLTQWKVN